jgi:hypothetical protein
VVLGKMASRDAERGIMSPWMNDIGVVFALSLSAPKSYPFEYVARIRWTNFGKSLGVGLSLLYSVSMGDP